MNAFYEHHKNNIRFVYRCFDRILLHAAIQPLNQRYRIERGIIELPNPHRTEPVLNVLLTSTINQYNLSLTFRGPLDKLQTSYVSDPPLATADIINLIARGQTTGQAAAAMCWW